MHLNDCLIAAAGMALAYAAGGATGLVLLVFGFSVSVVVLLLLREAYLRLDPDDDGRP